VDVNINFGGCEYVSIIAMIAVNAFSSS